MPFYILPGKKQVPILPNLKRTEYEYDSLSNLVKVTDPLGNETLMTYTRDRKLSSQTDPSGSTTAYEYDNENRLTLATDPAGNQTQLAYTDGSGCSSCASGTGNQIETITYPTFKKQFTYDTQGRKLTETDILSDTDSGTTTFEYDNAGNLIRKTDAKDNDTHYAYDTLNRLKLTADPAGGITSYQYDARDNLVSLTDANDNTTRFEYDRANRLTKEIRPKGQETVYVYDETGNLAQKTDAKNQLSVYSYDASNRLTRIRYYADASDPDPAKTVEFTYDNAGNLLTWNDGSASGTYTYDALNRKLTDNVDFGPFQKAIAYTWASNSRKSSYTDPSGNVYAYAYVNSQLTGIELPGTGTITTSAYKWNRPATIQYPGGTRQTRTYDPLMRLTSVTDTDPGSNAFMSYAYTHDKLDNITKNPRNTEITLTTTTPSSASPQQITRKPSLTKPLPTMPWATASPRPEMPISGPTTRTTNLNPTAIQAMNMISTETWSKRQSTARPPCSFTTWKTALKG